MKEQIDESSVAERLMLRKRVQVGSAGVLLVGYLVWRSVLALVGASPSPNYGMESKSVVNWNEVRYIFVLYTRFYHL